ncbi:tyrosine--tRNA ligase [Methylacidiphilum kamchatkense Kam1]|uniref:Tyrosine--tRNA ligase n=1 Tax=Methylacidiphilum kamchatkense Kam1 TaxID=1202785 RepID=A0A0C1V647_9BACT|nr:tyrosine--tRNA ligase [Methylacidiphilum kamchatkense]KIE59210.1 tyrosine--tRNA ligase [Methylacidiphilum kamchatkense Kam1]QDQ42829.1 tyrosyl-tRNA synthetase [Methylacidiphilum kamchatkense Kam1]
MHPLLKILTRGTEQVISEEELDKLLSSGKKLRIKFGVDPTSANLHLGHALSLLKLRQFQDLGHQVLLVIGDFTASIGDPSGRNTTRPLVPKEQILKNAQTYTEQAFKILDKERTEIFWNGSWFGRLSAEELLGLGRRVTVNQLLHRQDFHDRFTADQSIFLHELFYPLLQAWDSVMVKADIEIGGRDQLFNMLLGRDFQKEEGQNPQVVITLPILEGLDGSRKMSKSLGNDIGITEPPKEIFGKTMSISDSLMKRWFLVLFGEEVDPLANPMEEKKRLAEKIVTLFYGKEEAIKARTEFERVFSKKELPEEMPEFCFSQKQMPIVELLVAVGAVKSKSEARRLITQGGVSYQGKKVTDIHQSVEIQPDAVLRCGKRFFARIKPSS